MPRRLITSEIFRNDKVAELDYAGRLFFIGLICNADDDGRLKGSPKYLKASIFPYDELSIEQIVAYRKKCHDLGIALCYTVDNNDYIFLTGWEEHQSIRSDRRKPSTLPPPSDNHSATDILPNDNQVSPKCLHNINKGNIIKDNIIYIYSLWNEQKIKVHKKLTDDMQRAIANALKDYEIKEVEQAIKNYAEILKGEQYYFKYVWALKDFLKRGLEKFLDLEIAKSNYLKNNKGKDNIPNQGDKSDSKYGHMVKR